MNNKRINSVAVATLFLIPVIPAKAIAASASLSLSNVNITSTALDGGHGSYWDYKFYPFGGYNPADSTYTWSETYGYFLLYDKDYIDKDKFYYVDDLSFSTSALIPGASASGSIVRDLNLKSLNGYAEASDEYRWSTSNLGSREYFHGSGLVEFDIHADYLLTSDPGDNALYAYSGAHIKLISFINGETHLLFDKEMNFDSYNDPGMHSESGTISLKIFTQPGEFSGHFAWDTGLLISQIPEPQTYALLLAGLGLVGFSLRRKVN